MSKITRYDGNLKAFASSATGTYRTIFGDTVQSDDLTDQLTASFLAGWEIVTASEFPTLEDFNAAFYTHGQLLAYLHQVGVAEWNIAQEYNTGSVVSDGAGGIFISKVDANIGNVLPVDTDANWVRVPTYDELVDYAPLDSPTFTGTPTAPTATPGTNSLQLATTAYVDGKMVLGTSVASTSGSSIDFTGIPDWVKRITIMFDKVSLSGTDELLIQIGTGGVIDAVSYASSSGAISDSIANTTSGATSSIGFVAKISSSAFLVSGKMDLMMMSGNIIVSSHVIGGNDIRVGGGSKTLLGVLDIIRITTTGTDTFDAGNINILYEG